MTATTSKLGADMTDEQRAALEWAIRQASAVPVRGILRALEAILARQPAAIDKEAVAICTICNGYGRYQDGNSGTEADGYAPNIVECDCADEERRPEYRVAAPLANEASKPAAPSVEQDERGAFDWPPLPELPQTVTERARRFSVALFTEHQMQGYANAYGEAVRAALAAPPAQTALTDDARGKSAGYFLNCAAKGQKPNYLPIDDEYKDGPDVVELFFAAAHWNSHE